MGCKDSAAHTMTFEKLSGPMRWCLCEGCNEIIYVIVAPDACPKCGGFIGIRKLKQATQPSHPQRARPPFDAVRLRLESLMLEQQMVAMIRQPRKSESDVRSEDTTCGRHKNGWAEEEWTEEEWETWRREKGYRAWVGRA